MMFVFGHDDVTIYPSRMMMGYDGRDGKNGLCSNINKTQTQNGDYW